MDPVKFIMVAYSFSGIITFISFMPQLLRLWHDGTRSESVSIPSWAMMTFNSLLALGYGLMVAHDPLLILAAGSGSFGCLACLGLVTRNRYLRPWLVARVELAPNLAPAPVHAVQSGVYGALHSLGTIVHKVTRPVTGVAATVANTVHSNDVTFQELERERVTA